MGKDKLLSYNGVTVKNIAVIPAYNEAETIGGIIERTKQYVSDVVVVDDASGDETVAESRDHGAIVLEHTINMGVGGAVRTGYQYAIRNGYDFVVQVDADGQHEPEYLPKLLDVAEDCDMVIGSRYLNQSHKKYSLTRRLGIRIFTFLTNELGGVSITDVTSGYRVYRVETLQSILHQADKHWAIEQTLQAAIYDLEIREVSVEMPVRQTGNSHLTPFNLLLYPMRMVDTILRVVSGS